MRANLSSLVRMCASIVALFIAKPSTADVSSLIVLCSKRFVQVGLTPRGRIDGRATNYVVSPLIAFADAGTYLEPQSQALSLVSSYNDRARGQIPSSPDSETNSGESRMRAFEEALTAPSP